MRPSQTNEYKRAWYHANADKVARYRKKFRETHPEKYRAFSRDHRARMRVKVLAAYGNQCACCGETMREFLTIDHVRNDGAAQRRDGTWKMGGGSLDRLVLKQGCPPIYQLLCWNCNCAKGRYGKCPHERVVRIGHAEQKNTRSDHRRSA